MSTEQPQTGERVNPRLIVEFSLALGATENDTTTLMGRLMDVAEQIGATLIRAEVIPGDAELAGVSSEDPQTEIGTKDLFSSEVQEKLDTDLDDLLPDGRRGAPGLRRLLYNNGYTMTRHLLAVGLVRIADIRDVGPISVELLKLVLANKCSDVPFLEEPTAADIARFCDSLGQVPIQAVPEWTQGWGQPEKGAMTSVQNYLDSGNPANRATVLSFAEAFHQARLGMQPTE